MRLSKKKLPPLEEIEWDYIADDAPRCPACGAEWRGAPSVFVSVELGVAVVGGYGFYVSDEQARILQVLRSSCSRWITLPELIDLAYSDLPDCDIPSDPGPVETALRLLRRRLTTAGYQVQSRRNYGYKLMKVNDD